MTHTPRSNSNLKNTVLSILIGIFALHAPAQANDELEAAIQLKPDLKAGKRTYQLCGACHGKDGSGGLNGEFPSIAGQHRDVLIKQLSDIRNRNRVNPTMYPFASAKAIGGVQAVANVTAYIETMPVHTTKYTGPGDNLATGKALYDKQCTSCHQKDGSGDNANRFPKIQGQHFPYLNKQLVWIRDGVRKNANPYMVAVLQRMNDQELQAIADYVSRMKP